MSEKFHSCGKFKDNAVTETGFSTIFSIKLKSRNQLAVGPDLFCASFIPFQILTNSCQKTVPKVERTVNQIIWCKPVTF